MAREISEQTKRILAMADGTLTAAEVSAALGVSQSIVRAAVLRNRAYGGGCAIKPAHTGSAAYTKHSRGDWRCGGGMIEMVSGLAPDVQEWLIAQIPEDGDLLHVLRAIVVDAFEEERG